MMRQSALITLLLTIVLGITQAQEKLTIRTHNKELLTTAVNSYAKWAEFPSADENIRKIVMKVTLGTPVQDTMRCADWDYSDPIYLRQTGGKNGTKLNYEIGRMLTPYGGANAKGWAFQWEADITDFASLLRDSVLLDFTHGGGEPGHDRGWALTMEFEITKGEPVMQPIKIHQILNGVYPYGKPDDDIENYLAPVTLTTQPQTNLVRSRIIQTGHGMDKPDNCGEFCSRWRDVIWNGKQVSHKMLWKRCGDNPLYPQAGTWLYDRANWCPGYLVQPDIDHFRVRGGSSHLYDLDMEPYISQGVANQQISSYLIEYKIGKNTRDVELADIMAPSRKQIWGRYNPTVTNPLILVRNNTAQKVTSLEIEYGTVGMKTYKELIKVAINPFESVQLELANPLQSETGQGGEFRATVTKVNGGADQYTADNSFASPFDGVPVHKGNLILVFEPNKTSDSSNSYYVADSEGKRLLERGTAQIDNNQRYTDTLQLENGDYQFRFFDTDGNGLEFWSDFKGGNGRVYLLNSQGELVKYFDPDFGNDIRYNFKVDNSLAQENLDMTPAFWLDKTVTEGPFRIHLLLNNKKDKIKVSIVDYDSRPKAIFSITPPADGVLDLDVTPYVSGRHFVIVEQNGYKYLRRVQHGVKR